MNVDHGVWDKLTKLIVLLLVLAMLLMVGAWYLPLIRQNERLRKEIQKLEMEVRKEEETSKRLKASIEAMRDPRMVERLAREKLSYAKPGETIIRFESPPTNNVLRPR